MARAFGSVRLRWIVVLLAAGVLVVLSDVLFTWRQLTTSPSPSSTRGGSAASPATLQAIYDAVARANDSADVQSLTQFVDRLSESEAAELLHKIGSKASTSMPPAIQLTDEDDDALRLETEKLKAGEVQKMKDENRLKTLETQLLHTLNSVTQRTSEKRGVVLPLFDDLVPLGLSLLLELRSLGVTLPVEIPHCGDLDQKLVKTIEKKSRQLGQVSVYDACELAAREKSLLDSSKPIFCKDLDECHRKFRTFDIKVLGVIYSRFEEVMLVDADALVLQNPMPLWETNKFEKTGTLFFNDRISQTNFSLGYRPASRPDVTDLRHYLSKADVSVFRELPTISRANATAASDVLLPFEPSDILLNSHTWNGRSGHQLDSSLLLWSKKRQPRATTVLASFVSLNDVGRPPSYGDKELFFVACELAETQYAFSDFAVGAAGSDFKDHGEEKSVLCGQAAQYFPVKAQGESSTSMLYLNSDSIMTYRPTSQPMYFSKARAADFYPGSFSDWELPQECPFDVTGVPFSEVEIQRVLLRQRLHGITVEWERNALMSESENEQTLADDLVNTKLESLLKQLADGTPFQETTAAAPVTEPVATATPAPTVPESQANKWAEFMKNARERAEMEKVMETRLIHSLYTLSQETSVQRGIVLPLYDKITTLGVSLILQLRSLGVDLPIEIPHCGDFDEDYGETIMKKSEQLGEVYVYNACKRAVTAKSLLDPTKPLFCKDLDTCHRRYRNFAIKVLGVVYSRFEEIMLMDADALLFQTPMTLWETKKYEATGTLFFNDRIAEANFSMGLGYKPANRPNIMAIENYLSKANVDLFRHIPTLTRPNVSAEVIAADKSTVTLHFQPSEGLLKSHPWNGRSAHRVDSSIVLWNKKRQPRATAILASFISLNDVPRPPSYGDKELFFVACELAETQYTFSDFATGSAGADFRNHGANKSIICGSAAHHFPEKSDDTPIQEVSLLYMNTDYIMRYKPQKAPMYYSAARPRDFFPGTFEEKKLLMMCPFDITGVKFTDAEVEQIYQRQQFFDIASEWENSAKDTDTVEREAADSLTNEKLTTLLKNGPPLIDRTDPPKDSKKVEEEKKAAELKKKTADLQQQEKQLAHTLNQIAQQTTVKRGIVIPVYDGIIKLGISLVLELRTMGITEPIEMPHCGDLNLDAQKMYLSKKQLGTIWFYNVCERAAQSTSVLDSSRKVFCEKIEDCHAKFRGFIIKPLAVTFSRFEEIMMIDADTTFFVSPAKLWDSKKYNTTGNFLMHDRISHEKWFMAERIPGNPEVSVEQNYFSKFDVTPFRSLPTLERPKATVENPTSVTLNFEPSDFLLRSHSFNIRAGHQVDSSLVLWNKKRQPRATAILASFIALNDIASPPSYGDKELFFYASELAETQYSFSDHAIGAVGTKLIDGGPKNSTLCGDMAQVFPIHEDGVPDDDVPLFYFNSDRILWFRPQTEPVYYMKARPWEFYPGAFGERRQECPFDITVGKLSEDEERHLAGRQHLYEVVDAWDRVAKENPANLDDQNASIDEVLRKNIAEMQGKNPADVAPSPPRENKLNDQVDRTTQMMEKQLVYTLSQITQVTTTKRGIVMPLYEPIARLGFSLILELRAMGVTLPIEVPHCTDLKPETVELIRTKKELGEIRAYDVCELAAKAKSVTNSSRPVFCADIDGCRAKFRSFMIKPLAVTYSQFEEILMLDADTTFFVNPTVLFDSVKFKTTGNLLMNDRISHDWWFMAERVSGKPDVSVEQNYFATFDVTPFRPLPTLDRPKATLENKTPVKLGFEPSDFLLSSHSFNLRSGHQVDSSLVMWNKKRQPRATAILASFVAENDIASPPSYGDKELFFYASELAETQYSFSDHAIGAVGTKVQDGGPKNSTLCGDMAQVFPIHHDDVADDDVPLFYLNSDRILYFKPDVEPVYYMKARPWEHYPGAFGSRPQECPFNITVGRFMESHINHLAERRKFSEQVKAW
ncbi:putative alpha-1,3-mannosyltransferase MNN14 [Phytophthora ramorum]|uniref:putative alpha-1,3-mannosyltransferase MNN14 n=1 Tax=Phytophthora ramorum TaxID=164328 RepID=UPI00309AF8E7|nr:putative alpha-1,3-mannosyltransferase MNN14 [Phytophthora ramorum]